MALINCPECGKEISDKAFACPNFGFNIGSEYGGLHYGVVLDNKNDHASPVITVIPLTSTKYDKKMHKNNVELGNEIYRSVKLKYDTISKALRDEQEEIRQSIELFSNVLSMTEIALNEIESLNEGTAEYSKKLQDVIKYFELSTEIRDTWEKKKEHNEAEQAYLSKIGAEISQMKEGSTALVSQITTVSKMRIFDPRNLKGVLAGISLSEQNMDKINQKVKELYVF